VTVVLAFAPLASILDDAQDLSSIVLAAIVFGALFLVLKALEHA
jgi:heme/copper-type cytochrome/quinol oxidase subunit 3